MKYHNIVHLSDLHLKPAGSTERFNQDLIIDALTNDLSELKDTPFQPDCIVFSGDLVQAADEGQYGDVSTLISLLAHAAGLTEEQVFVIPGNHDASRATIGPNIPKLIQFRKAVLDIDQINGLVRDPKFATYASSVFADFEHASASFGSKYRVSSTLFVQQYFLRDLNLAIVCLNSATLSGAGLAEDVRDEGMLTIPERSLVEAFKRVPANAQVMVVSHHPISMFSDETQRYIKPLLVKDADIYLSGHMHRTAPEQISAPQGRCMFVQAGSLYATRRWWNGYAIISIASGEPHFRIGYRKWQEERREFGIASELSDEGVIYSSPESRGFWAAITPRVPAKAMETWRTNSFLPFITDLLCDEGPAQAGDVFVQPEFERDRYVEVEGSLEKATKPDQISFEAATVMPDNLVIAARTESGKTTLIRKWALDLAGKPFSSVGWTVPIVVRFHEIKRYLPQFEATLKARLPDLPSGATAKSMFESGQITLFVDDADLKASDKLATLVALIQKFPASRYVLLTSTPYLQGAGIAPVIAPGVPFAHLRLKVLRKSQILELIESRGTKDPTRADQLLQRMTQEAASLNVPITPVTGTFLIQIYTEDNGKPLINRANLIERYVEIVLEKFAPADLLPAAFDYRNKSDVLSYIAAHMCRQGEYALPSADLIALIDSYLKRFGLRFPAADIVEYFAKARIFSREGDMISFRLSAFLSYFAALRMSEDDEFKQFILAEDRYLSFRGEISFYSAISRKDTNWLRGLHSRFQALSKEVWKDAAPEIRDGTLLNNFVPLGADAQDEDIFELERRIFETPLTEDERREALDADDEDISGCTQSIVRHDRTDPPATWLGQLIMLSDMLKNMELIETSEKEAVLEDVIKGWLQFVSMTMGIVPTLARKRQMSYGGIEYRIVYPDDMKAGEIARRIMSYLPISCAKIAALNLGTEKLRSQLEIGIGDDPAKTDPSVQFMRGSILAQIGVDGLDAIMQPLRQALKNHRYLEEVFVRQLAEIVVRFRLPPKQLANVRLLAANAIIDLEKPKPGKAVQRRNQVIQSLTSGRLRVRAGETSEDKP